MIEVEERRLRTFQQQVLVGIECVVQQLHGVDHVWRETPGQCRESLDELVDIQGLAAERDDLGVVADGAILHCGCEAGGVDHLAGAHTLAAGLVGVRRPDALQRRADAGIAATGLVQRVQRLVPREDQVGLTADLQLGATDATGLQGVDLVEQRGHVDDDAVADHGDHMRVQHAGGHQLQRISLGADHDGVAGIVPTLVPHHVGVLAGQQVDDLGFALIAPLGSNDDGDGHGETLLAASGGTCVNPTRYPRR